jgi:ATP-dependent Clp protease ATP-binding subunit ClpA
MSRAEIVARLGGIFRPEFLDRIEHFIPFRALGVDARRRVSVVQLETLRRQLEQTHGVGLTWSSEILERAAGMPQGETGARNILRWVQGEVKPAVVDALLSAPDGNGPGRTVALTVSTDGTPAATMVDDEGAGVPCGMSREPEPQSVDPGGQG